MNKIKKHQIFLKGIDKTDSVSSFEQVGHKYKIVFKNGKAFNYNARNVKIIDSVLNEGKPRSVFSYFLRVAEVVGLETIVDGGKKLNILSNSFEKIGFVSKYSLLGHYLNEDNDIYMGANPKLEGIYPFGFNSSQKDAVEKALSNRVSIIEGPPGTGKTQTILNLIANIVSNDGSVAIVSSNNSATQNVLDKLNDKGVGFISAYLGNTRNKMEFIDSQTDTPNIDDWLLEEEKVSEINEEVSEKYSVLDNMLNKQIKLSNLKQERSRVDLERTHFYLDYKESVDKYLDNYLIDIDKSNIALNYWIECENFEKKNIFYSFFYLMISIFIRSFYRKKIINRLLENYSIEELIKEFQKRFYDLKLKEIDREIQILSSALENFDFSKKMKDFSDLSLKLFKSKIADRYIEGRNTDYNLIDLKRNASEFIKDYPVILSTTYSLRSCLSNDVAYDYVIVDESSQVDLCTGALAMSCAKNIVVVGDLKQLPHVVNSKMAKITDALFAEYKLSECFRYKNQSLLSSLVQVFPSAPRTLLREHYRCHPKIIEFCNKKFYNGDLIILTESDQHDDPLVVYKTVEGNHARNRVNKRQVDVIKNEIIPELNLNTLDGSLGIITPYRNQTNVLKKSFEGVNVKADTVDKFQGQENEVVIISTVDNEITDFTDNANRLNVAVSRAINQLVLIVNEGDELKDKNIGDLVNYIEYNNFTIVQSNVRSVFDYLFKSYAQKRRDFFKGKKKNSKFDSENLMFNVLENVFKELKVIDHDIAVHVPLKMIIKNTNLLDDEEERFVMKTQSHVDFLIYNSLSKKPEVAIEVDGASFHKDNGRQSVRDQMKDEIFKKYEIPLYRFRTDDSEEKSKITKILLKHLV